MIEKVKESVTKDDQSVKKKKSEVKVKKRKAESNEENSQPKEKKVKKSKIDDTGKKVKKSKIDDTGKKVKKSKIDDTGKKIKKTKDGKVPKAKKKKTSSTDEAANGISETETTVSKIFSRPDKLLESKNMALDLEDCPGAVDLNEVDIDLTADFDFGPGTIESDEEENSNEYDDDLKPERKREEADFYEGFAKDKQYQDAWETILTQVRGKFVHNLKDTVAKVMEEHKQEVGKEFEELGNESEEGEADEMKLKPGEERRIQRLKTMPDKKMKAEKDEESKDDKMIFEEAIPAKEGITFLEMNLSRPVLKAIEEMGFEIPTPIQATTIPIALQGRDICGCAATGTGKTAAYLLPIIERLLFKPKEDLAIRVLILTPTRELGLQVYEVTRELTKFTSIATSISVGGLNLKMQQSSLKKVPDIVIATPGRLIDHLNNSPSFHLHDVEVLVLDEADRMLEENFESQMKKIIEQCPKNRQSMLFSATMTMQVRELALVSLKNPVKIFTNNNTDVAMNLRQEVVRIRFEKTLQRDAILLYLVMRYFNQHTLVFAPTRSKAHRLHIMLTCAGIESGELHGDLKQVDRVEALRKFKDQKIDVLVATDVAARGLDIKGIQTVINYILPREYSRYVHRVGRTARAGHCGRSVSLVADNEFKLLQRIRANSKQPVFERVIKREVLTKYWTRVQELEPLIDRVLEQEQEDIQAMRIAAHMRKDKKDKVYRPRVNKQFLDELPKDPSKIGRRRMKALKKERPHLAKKIVEERSKKFQPKKDMCPKRVTGKYREKSLKWGHTFSEKEQNARPQKRKVNTEAPRSTTSFDTDLVGFHKMRTSFKGRPLKSSNKGPPKRDTSEGGMDQRGPGKGRPGQKGPSKGFPDKRGSGKGFSDRMGSGKGFSDRMGSGKGFSDRRGSGKGFSDRMGSGKGFSDRRGSGKGFSDRMGSGKGFSDRRGSGKGFSDRSGSGRGFPSRKGPSKGGPSQRMGNGRRY